MNSIPNMAEYACNHLALFISFTINNSSYLTALSPILHLAKHQILTRQSLFQSSESNPEKKKKKEKKLLLQSMHPAMVTPASFCHS